MHVADCCSTRCQRLLLKYYSSPDRLVDYMIIDWHHEVFDYFSGNSNESTNFSSSYLR